MLDRSVPWTQVPQVEYAGSFGDYSTRFDMSTIDSRAVHVGFGSMLNTMKAWLNGKQVPPIDPTNPVVEVKDSLVTVTNIMHVQVSTSLFCSLLSKPTWITFAALAQSKKYISLCEQRLAGVWTDQTCSVTTRKRAEVH
jgi:hypothetical protein